MENGLYEISIIKSLISRAKNQFHMEFFGYQTQGMAIFIIWTVEYTVGKEELTQMIKLSSVTIHQMRQFDIISVIAWKSKAWVLFLYDL